MRKLLLFLLATVMAAQSPMPNISNLSCLVADDLTNSSVTSWTSRGVPYTFTNAGTSPGILAGVGTPGSIGYLARQYVYFPNLSALTNTSVPQVYATWGVLLTADYTNANDKHFFGQDKSQGTSAADAEIVNCCGDSSLGINVWYSAAGDTSISFDYPSLLRSTWNLYTAWASFSGGNMTVAGNVNRQYIGAQALAWTSPTITTTVVGAGFNSHSLAFWSGGGIAAQCFMTRTPTPNEVTIVEDWLDKYYFNVANWTYIWAGFNSQNGYATPTANYNNLKMQGSNDGTNWTEIPVASNASEVRDSTVVPWQGGYVLATTNPAQSSINVRTSKYGALYGAPTAINMCRSGVGITGQWAPEGMVMPDGLLHIAVACILPGTNKFEIDDVSTADATAQTWNTPTAITWASGQQPTSAIDPFRFFENGNWYLLYTSAGYQFGGYICWAKSSNWNGPYTNGGTGDWTGQWGADVEGPTIIRLPNGHWRVFMDSSAGGSSEGGTTTPHYYQSDSSLTTFEGSTWTHPTIANTTPYSSPGFTAGTGYHQHGTVILNRPANAAVK